MKCKCLGRYATWVCRAVLAGSLLMAPMVTENFVAASNASTSVTTTDEADAILKEAKAIVAQPGTFYTLYVGMPHSDFRANFSNLPGWEVSHYDDYKGSLAKKNITRWKYERVLPVKNSFIKQELYILGNFIMALYIIWVLHLLHQIKRQRLRYIKRCIWFLKAVTLSLRRFFLMGWIKIVARVLI